MDLKHFDGSDYEAKYDFNRLTRQHDKIRDLMLDGIWRSLSEIAFLTGFSEASISAQLRHLRKPRFGSFVVEKRRRPNKNNGLFEYQVRNK